MLIAQSTLDRAKSQDSRLVGLVGNLDGSPTVEACCLEFSFKDQGMLQTLYYAHAKLKIKIKICFFSQKNIEMLNCIVNFQFFFSFLHL